MELQWLMPNLWWLIPLAGLPMIAHLIRRPPSDRWMFGAMYLLRQLKQRNTTRNRIQDWWLLLLRILLLLFLALALLQPQVRWLAPNSTEKNLGRVVILIDTSLSMNQTLSASTDVTALSWAKEQVLLRIQEEGVQGEFVLATFNASVDVVRSDWTRDTMVLSTEIQNVPQSEFSTDLVGALRWGRRMLEGKGGEIWLYTDQSISPSDGLKEEMTLMVQQQVGFHPMQASIESPTNLAVIGATYGEGMEGGTVRFVIQNFGQVDVETRCTVTLPDGTEIHTIATVPANVTTESFVTVPRVSDGGVGRISILDTRLQLDNQYYFQLPKIGANRVVLVDGSPGTTPIDSEVYYLERALSSNAGGQRISLEVVGELSALQLDVSEQSLLVLANVANPQGNVGELVEYVRSGGSVLLTLGDQSNVDHINQAWSTLLPVPLGERHVFAETYADGRAFMLPSMEQPIFEPFHRGGLSGFTQVRWLEVFTFAEVLPTEVEVMLSLDNGLPVLVSHRVGEGRVTILLGSLDMAGSNFPLQSVYMPFMQRLVRMLGGQDQGGHRLHGFVGETVRLSLAEMVNGLEWKSISEQSTAIFQQQSVVFEPQKSGAYELAVPNEEPLAWLAVNTNRLESNIEPNPPLLSVAAEVEPTAFYESRDVGKWLALAALGALMLQALFSGRRNQDEDAASSPSDEVQYAK